VGVRGADTPPRLALRHPEEALDVSIGEVLYLILVVAIAWWAFDILKNHL
jgi:hypothetical protein